jgi:hypothetical protein
MLSLDAGISMKSSIGGIGDEFKGRSVTKDGAKSTSPSKINLLNGTSPATLNPDVMFAGVIASGNANPTSSAMMCMLIGFPGWSFIHELQYEL